jgi:hypothetical protein
MSGTKNHIIKFSRISANSLFLNDEPVFSSAASSFEFFADDAYKFLNVSYPKFHKMDALSKLGFLAAEILVRGLEVESLGLPDRRGIVLSNKNSSLDTDIKYHNMLKKGVASPAVFVYSLPNIVIGEICIRHHIKGENVFFVSAEYDIPFQVNYVNSLLNTGVIDSCLCGWVELVKESYEGFMYLVVKDPYVEGMPFTVDTIKNCYLK